VEKEDIGSWKELTHNDDDAVSSIIMALTAIENIDRRCSIVLVRFYSGSIIQLIGEELCR
jgi:hypothetical protein